MPRIPANQGGGFQKIDPAGRITVPVSLRPTFSDTPLYLVSYSEQGRFPRLYVMTEEGHATILKNLEESRFLADDPALRAYLDRSFLYLEMTAEIRTMDEMGRITLGKAIQEKAQIKEWYRISGNRKRPIFTVWAKEVFLQVQESLDISESPIAGISTAGVITGLGGLPLSLLKGGQSGRGDRA
jgi:DNA-binding transcriptional regulator/RsmH inhibitor MraZ